MRFSTTQKYLAILILALALSAGGIVWAVYCSHNKDDAGRGGALAVAVAFGMLFVSRGQGARVYDILAEEGPELLRKIEALHATEPAQPASAGENAGTSAAETKVNALLARLRIDANEQRIQNIYLALTSVIGTVAWGFGDLIEKRFI